MFMFDMVVSFFSEYLDGEVIVRDLPSIFWHYLKTWFLLDFMAAFPFDLILGSDSYYTRMTRLLRLPRIYKLMKYSRLSGFIYYFLEDETESREERRKIFFILRHIGKLTKMLIGLIFVTYFISCIWFWISQRTQGNNWVKNNELEDVSGL